MSSKINVLVIGVLIAMLLFGCQSNNKTEQKENPLNVLLITLDDMGYGTTGVEGCTVPGITPYIDKLSSPLGIFISNFLFNTILKQIFMYISYPKLIFYS